MNSIALYATTPPPHSLRPLPIVLRFGALSLIERSAASKNITEHVSWSRQLNSLLRRKSYPECLFKPPNLFTCTPSPAAAGILHLAPSSWIVGTDFALSKSAVQLWLIKYSVGVWTRRGIWSQPRRFGLLVLVQGRLFPFGTIRFDVLIVVTQQGELKSLEQASNHLHILISAY